MSKVMPFLPFTYNLPGDDDPPLWVPGDPRDKRVAIIWKPWIGSSAEQAKTQHSLTRAPGILWTDLNIAEIRVESRKAYEILNRIVPAGQSFIVRINPLIPEKQNFLHCEKRDVTIFTNGEDSELVLACQIAKAVNKFKPLIVCGIDDRLISESTICVFVHRSYNTADHLRYALEYGSKIVTSDAGAAGEWLARFGFNGGWHVARSWNVKEYANMIRDLMGAQNDIYQTSIVDNSPYIKAWGNV